MDRFVVCIFRGFHDPFCECRVCMNHVGHLRDRRPQLHRHGGFMNEICSMSTDDVDAENLAVIGPCDDLAESCRISRGLSLPQGRVSETADLQAAATRRLRARLRSLACLRLGEADTT